jgi:hypothetical protein
VHDNFGSAIIFGFGDYDFGFGEYSGELAKMNGENDELANNVW